MTREWRGAPERLDRVMQELGLSRSRSAAQHAVSEGRVAISGVTAAKAGTRVQTGQEILVHDADHFVSRGAHKLIAGLDTFAIPVEGRVALDVGASTGGFTQVLLERGASSVLAVDVGRDQLAAELRSDPRVRLWEGCNARYLTPESLTLNTGERRRPELIVGDLSFISLTHVLPALAGLTTKHTDLVLLIKPQFEVGRAEVGSGVVTDADLHLQAIKNVVECAAGCSLRVTGLRESPVLGGHGNREFLAHFVPGEPRTTQELNEMMAVAVHGEGRGDDSRGSAKAVHSSRFTHGESRSH